MNVKVVLRKHNERQGKGFGLVELDEDPWGRPDATQIFLGVIRATQNDLFKNARIFIWVGFLIEAVFAIFASQVKSQLK